MKMLQASTLKKKPALTFAHLLAFSHDLLMTLLHMMGVALGPSMNPRYSAACLMAMAFHCGIVSANLLEKLPMRSDMQSGMITHFLKLSRRCDTIAK